MMTGFKRARTDEQVAMREKEIVSACGSLYSEGGLDAVNLKAIAERTSLSRPTIYNYYDTKEEILLDLIKTDFDEWDAELRSGFDGHGSMSKEEFCRFLTDSLSGHLRMLEFFSRHLYTIEMNSRLEKVVGLKIAIGRSIHTLDDVLERSFGYDDDERALLISLMFTFMHGLYPMTHPTEMQREAASLAGHCITGDFKDICFNGLMRLMRSP